MNLDKEVLNISTGKSMVKTGFTLDELKQYAKKDENGKPIILDRGLETERFDLIDDESLMPRETVRNIVLNCLANYKIVETKEAWQISNLGVIFLDDSEKEVKLQVKYWRLLEKVLDFSTDKAPAVVEGQPEAETVKSKGIFKGWAIAQVKQELGMYDKDEEYESVDEMKKVKDVKPSTKE